MRPALRIYILSCFIATSFVQFLPLSAGVSDAQPSGWQLTASTGLKESYDSNIFLQSTRPDPAIAGAAQPNVASLITSATASVGAEYRLTPTFAFTAIYTPELVRFHSAPSENYDIHRTALTANVRGNGTILEFQNNTVWTDGSTTDPLFGGPGGAPAIGGAGVRDRRAAFVERGLIKLTCSLDHWFVRSSAACYVHNFLTQQMSRPYYANYIDRSEESGGVDLGWALTAKSSLVAGFRYGRQTQGKLNGTDSPFDSVLRRFIAGFEGEVTPWLQLNLLIGPETRSFAPGTPAGFDRTKTLLWIDGSSTLKLSKDDTVVLALRRFEQPASTSVSIYEDITTEVTWRHRFNEHHTLAAGCRILRGDWQAPVNRDDRIITPNVTFICAFVHNCSVEFGYSLDRAISRIPATSGREYRRELGWVSAKYSF